MKLLSRTIGAVAFSALVLSGVNSSHAAFVNVDLGLANSETLGTGISFDFSVDVDAGAGTAAFKLINTSVAPNIEARVHRIYFQDGLGSYFGSTPSYSMTQTGVTFVPFSNGNSEKPPGIFDSPTTGNSWTASDTLLALKEKNGGSNLGGVRSQNKNGHDTDEIVITFSGITGLADSLALATILADPDLDARFAIHLGDADGGNSAVLDSWPVPVPVPASLPLFLSGLAALGFIGRRRKRLAAA